MKHIFKKSLYVAIEKRRKLIEKRNEAQQAVWDYNIIITDKIKEFFLSNYKGKQLHFAPYRIKINSYTQYDINGIRYNEKENSIEVTEYHYAKKYLNNEKVWCDYWQDYRNKIKLDMLVEMMDMIHSNYRLIVDDYEEMDYKSIEFCGYDNRYY